MFETLSLGSGISAMDRIICILERGTLINKFFSRKKPENKFLILRRETRQLLWSSVSQDSRSSHEGCMEMREIREIRPGKQSKEFDKWPDEARRVDVKCCFVVYYGSDFKLKSFSVAAISEKECDLWLKGLKHLTTDTNNSPYPLQTERWLRKEFYALENSKDT